MSKWYDVKKEDISFSEKGDEIHFYLYSDDFGAVYCSAIVSDVKEKLKTWQNKKKQLN